MRCSRTCKRTSASPSRNLASRAFPDWSPTMTRHTSDHIVLSSHPSAGKRGPFYEVRWGAPTAAERGPVIASLTDMAQRNAIGTHSGAYAVYRALAVASGALQRDHRPD